MLKTQIPQADNCEHVIRECAHLVESLLHACPGLHLLATSREALQISGEVIWRVPSMRADEAAQLFADRAQKIKTDFSFNEQNVGEVTTICRRLQRLRRPQGHSGSRSTQIGSQEITKAMDTKTFDAMVSIQNQAGRLEIQVAASHTPEDLREALRLMTSCALRLETAAHHLTERGVDAALRYVSTVKGMVDAYEIAVGKESRNATE